MDTSEELQKVDEILKEIEAIKLNNDETIKAINDHGAAKKFHYTITQSLSKNQIKFDVTEKEVHEISDNIINSWSSANRVHAIADIFNDKINYSCSGYNDLIRLNKDMLPVARKYELFGDSERARQETLKFLENFQFIQECLKEVESIIQDDVSRLEDIKGKINEINAEFEKLKQDWCVVFDHKEDIPFGELFCYQCGAKPSRMAYYKSNTDQDCVDNFIQNGYSALCIPHKLLANDNKWHFVCET